MQIFLVEISEEEKRMIEHKIELNSFETCEYLRETEKESFEWKSNNVVVEFVVFSYQKFKCIRFYSIFRILHYRNKLSSYK